MEHLALLFLDRLLQRGIPQCFLSPAPPPLPALYGKLWLQIYSALTLMKWWLMPFCYGDKVLLKHYLTEFGKIRSIDHFMIIVYIG